jgi:hypothetical protein
MISRCNLLSHRHFHYLLLIENLLGSCFGKEQSICSFMCMLNLVTYTNNVLWRSASDAGYQSIQFTDNIFLSIAHPCFSAYGRPNIDWHVRFQTTAWDLALCKCFCKASFLGGSWWHWMVFLFTKQKESYLNNITNWRNSVDSK